MPTGAYGLLGSSIDDGGYRSRNRCGMMNGRCGLWNPTCYVQLHNLCYMCYLVFFTAALVSRGSGFVASDAGGGYND